ncbi:hypothetical protein BED47_17665 [Gottfriedia luciferensis]|uniref:Uncharacterized protein n=1 Tax=Gottfriedia luciferensis TaxID=178774 RepID=A0ABX2ZTQ2_9BACI|nr:hypothetical protein BED47_17665 [Gottfriedia luciferensis]SFD43393.1 hypothetical protein SAMN02799633_03794 [Bacillus sp. UNCCL81]
MHTFFDEKVDWNGGVLDSYWISGKAKESRPMESEHPVMEINITLLLLRKFGNLIDKVVFQQRETTFQFSEVVFLFIQR